MNRVASSNYIYESLYKVGEKITFQGLKDVTVKVSNVALWLFATAPVPIFAGYSTGKMRYLEPLFAYSIIPHLFANRNRIYASRQEIVTTAVRIGIVYGILYDRVFIYPAICVAIAFLKGKEKLKESCRVLLTDVNVRLVVISVYMSVICAPSDGSELLPTAKAAVFTFAACDIN